ncbi:hypothetical protein CC78DRAFT_578106 [Lojkania enalia]|uniref:Uncharacterized protein n=1 Tax=Lojkania enalia TaxID=147567 RepID=A0A9P4KEB9_9PLEO|nr:hypothetical protein CC78DRAFT_578106 [Didymosphaeria enalia]
MSRLHNTEKRRAKWVSGKEIQRRRERGLCAARRTSPTRAAKALSAPIALLLEDDHQQEQDVSYQQVIKDWEEFKKNRYMDGKAISVHALVNQTTYASCMIDSGSLANAMVSPSLVKKAGLQCIDIVPRRLLGINGEGWIYQVAKYTADIEGFKDTGWVYVATDSMGYDILFRRAWMDRLRVTIAPAKRSIYIHSTRQRIRILSKEGEPVPTLRGHISL